jgi:hypothetical protein
MGAINKKTKVDSNDYWEVSHAAGLLTGQACTISAQHIQDGMLRIQFNREVAYYARGIVRDVEDGRKSAEEGLRALKDEHALLIDQQMRVLSQSVGLVAGGFQFAGGVAICSVSAGVACAGGIFMMAHGMNNIHENAVNLWEGRSDTVGATRMTYRKLSEIRGYGKTEGDIAYGLADIATSLYGTFRNTLKPDAWRLYRYIETDYIRAYKSTSNWILGFDAASGAFTTKSIYDELKQKNE